MTPEAFARRPEVVRFGDDVGCSDCHGHGTVLVGEDLVPCRCKHGVSLYPSMLGTPPRYWAAAIEDFEPFPASWRAVPTPAAWCFEAPGFLIHGSPGTGKTHLAIALLHAGVRDGQGGEPWCPVVGRFIQVHALLEARRRTFDGDQDAAGLLLAVDRADFLILDDLGAERATKWTESELTELFDRLYVESKPLIVTTNLSPAEIGGRYGQRLLGRLLELCRPFELTGTDRRIEAAKQRARADKVLASTSQAVEG